MRKPYEPHFCVLGLGWLRHFVDWVDLIRSVCGFLFLYFLFSFFTKIYVHVRNLYKYTPATLLPGGRDLAARQPGGRGLFVKNSIKNYAEIPEGPAARQQGGLGAKE